MLGEGLNELPALDNDLFPELKPKSWSTSVAEHIAGTSR